MLTLLPIPHSGTEILQQAKESFYSNDYLSRSPGFDLHFTANAAGFTQVAFLLVPHKAADHPLRFETVHSQESTSLLFELCGEAVHLRLGKQQSEFAGLKTDAELAVLFRGGSASPRCLVLNGSFLAYKGEMLFQSSSAIDFADVLWERKQPSVELSESDADDKLLSPPAKVISLKDLAL